MVATQPPLYTQAIDFALDVANGRSRLSKLVPPALLAVDAVLCGLIIWKIPCKLVCPLSFWLTQVYLGGGGPTG